MRVFDAFAGIGGFSLGLELTGGFHTAGVCELDPFCRAVLANRFPDAWQHDDITTLTGDLIRERCGEIDLLTGGVPCQPASVAGNRKGVDDARWLWPAFLRILRELRPVWLLAENVPGFINLKPCGLDWLQRELEAAGYQSLALLFGADDVGAPHRRKRVWIMAHRDGEQRRARAESQHVGCCERTRDQFEGGFAGDGLLANTASGRRTESKRPGSGEGLGGPAAELAALGGDVDGVAHAESGGFGVDGSARRHAGHADVGGADHLANAARGIGHRWGEIAGRRTDRGIAPGWPSYPGQRQYAWEESRVIELPMVPTVDGFPFRLAKFANRQALRAAGNAVIPAIVTLLGMAILDASENS